jgi:hypothetical protein
MSLTTKEIAELKKIVARANELIAKSNGRETVKTSARRSKSTRMRRSGKDLVAFRRMLKAERKAGVPVSQLAKKHGVSPSYIYQIG